MQLVSKCVAMATLLPLREAAAVVTAAFADLHARVEAVVLTPHPQVRLDAVADLAVVGRRATLLSTWAVQAYFYDLGGTCGVELVALGETGFVRAFLGRGSTASLTRSVHSMDVLVGELRARDPHVQLIA